jgi:hypothetical protein
LLEFRIANFFGTGKVDRGRWLAVRGDSLWEAWPTVWLKGARGDVVQWCVSIIALDLAMANSSDLQPALDESIGHDQAFKELISTFFMEFLELFLPEFAATIDPTSVTFLQQEYFVDLVEGEEKIVDLLAEVKLAGEDATILIHLEPQSTAQTIFPQRLFFYFARLHQKHLKPIYPIAVFSYDKPQKAAKTNYTVGFPHLKVLEFNFAAIQLNRLDWRDYLDRPNPVAAALMSKMSAIRCHVKSGIQPGHSTTSLTVA